MSDINTTPESLDAGQLGFIQAELVEYEHQRPDVFALATVASLARSIEPELLRSLRLGLDLQSAGRRVTVAAESALWFSNLIESRGADSITLLPEALQVLRSRLQTGGLLDSTWQIVAEAHQIAPDVLRWEERLVYLALSGRNEELEDQVIRGIGSLRYGTRLPLANWIASMWPRLPSGARSHPLMAKLHRMAAGMTLRRASKSSSSDISKAGWILDFTRMPTRELGITFSNRRFVIGDQPDALYGLQVPDLDPVEIDIGFGESNKWNEQRVIRKGEFTEVEVGRSSVVRLRTLAGRIYHLEPELFDRTQRRYRVGFSFSSEKREFVAKVAHILADRFGEEKILYDRFHKAEFARADLGFHLPKLYHDSTDLIVAVFAPGYSKKRWDGLEWRAIFDLIKKGRTTDVMLTRFEHVEVEGLFSLAGFTDLDDETPESAATMILERLALNEGKPKAHYTRSIAAHGDAPVPSIPNNLPRLSSFFGRERELRAIADALSPKTRTWGALIDGPGGMGKTSLAIKAAQSVPPDTFHRILFLSSKERTMTADGERKLSQFVVPGYLDVLNEIAHQIGQPDLTKHPETERARSLIAALEPVHALLVLDNLDSLPKSQQDQLYEFLSQLPSGCKAIVTSRRRTDVDARIMRLGKLEQDATLALLADLEGDRPLLKKASKADRVRLYEETGGNPLILRWIVGQLGRGSCRTIGDALTLCRRADKENDPLEFIFGDLLETFTDTETKALAVLTYFTQMLEVERIAELAGLPKTVAQIALSDLANRALVVPDEEEKRFALVPMVADFLRNKRPEIINETGNRLEKQAYALVVENGYQKHDRFPALDAAWPTVAAALPRFLAGENERFQTVCDALDTFLNFTGRWDELLALSRDAESRAESATDPAKAGWRAYKSGFIHYQRGESAEVLACANRAEAHWKNASAGAKERAAALRLRGMGHRLAKNYPAAIAAFRDAADLGRSLGSESLDLATDLNALAETEQDSGDFDAAERDYRDALRIARTMNDDEGIAIYSGDLASLALARRDWPSAEASVR